MPAIYWFSVASSAIALTIETVTKRRSVIYSYSLFLQFTYENEPEL